MVIENYLLHLQGQLGPLSRVKRLAEFCFERIEFRALIFALILGSITGRKYRKPIFRVASWRLDVGHCINIPVLRIFYHLIVVGRIVDINGNADILERSLGRLGQQWQLLAARIGQPFDDELLAIFLANAIAIGVNPTSLLQNRLGTFRVVLLGFNLIAAKGRTCREYAISREAIALQQFIDKVLLIDSHGNRLADSRVSADRIRVKIHLAKEAARCGYLRDGVFVILEQRIAFIRHAISSLHLTGLQGIGQRIAIRYRADDNLIKFRRAAPIVLIFLERQMVISLHIRRNVRAGTGHHAILKASIDINDAAIRVTEIIQQRRFRLRRFNRDFLSIGFNRSNLQILLRPFVVSNQMLQTLLYRLAIHLAAGRIRDIIAQRNLPGQRIGIFPFGCQPGLDFHGIGIFYQRLANTITDASPASISIMRIDIGFLVGTVKRRVANSKHLASIRLPRLTAATAG